MPRSSNQKSKILCLERIFQLETDENHMLSLEQIIDSLAAKGICAERKSLYDDIETLRQNGMDIISVRRKTTYYYLGERIFEQPELQLLANSVACSKFITDKKSRSLIDKISSLTSCHLGGELKKEIIVSNRIKTMNEQIYYNIDAIQQAIKENRKISFLYYHFGPDKKKFYHNSRQPLTISPYALTWRDENYYCVCFNDKYQAFSNFRVDKMESISINDQPRHKKGDFNVGEYSKQLFGMFGGELENVTLRFDDSLSGVVIDRFGTGTLITRGDGSFTVVVKLAVSPNFFGWLFQFGGKAEIVSPQRVRDDFREHIKELKNLYK